MECHAHTSACTQAKACLLRICDDVIRGNLNLSEFVFAKEVSDPHAAEAPCMPRVRKTAASGCRMRTILTLHVVGSGAHGLVLGAVAAACRTD